MTLGFNLFGMFFLVMFGYMLFHNSLEITQIHADYALEQGWNDTADEIELNRAKALEVHSVFPVLLGAVLMMMPLKLLFA